MRPSHHLSKHFVGKTQQGLTLVELLVSLLLGAFMSLGMVGVYLDSKRNYAAEEEMARMQENGRYTLNMLKRELNMAGLFGGDLAAEEIPAPAIGTDCASGNWALDATNAIEFTNNHDSSSDPVTSNGTTLSCIDGSEIQPNTDVLAIKRTAGEPSLRSGAFSANFSASSDERWYMRVVNYGNEREWSKLAGADLEDPNGPYDPNDVDTELAYWEAYTRVYYIRNYAEDTTDGIPTLCVETLVGDDMVEQCLVEGIEEMQIEFGIDTDTDGVVNIYTDAPTAADMAGAIMARIYLLVRSTDEMIEYRNTKTYQLGRRTVNAKNDAYMRRVFTTTVQVRNAILPVG